MKNYSVVLVIAISLLFATTADTAEALSEVDALKKQLNDEQDLQSQHALIKNEADLEFYQSITYPGFPLNAFSNEHVRQDFIDSLLFRDNSMVRFNTHIIATLSYADAYKVLSLFGQSYLAEFVVPMQTAENKNTIRKPYLSNAEYPLLAQLRAIDNQDQSGNQRLANFMSFYDKTLLPALSQESCSERGPKAILAILDSFYLIGFYSNNPKVARAHSACFNEYIQRNPESKYHTAMAEDVYKSLVSARQLVLAEALQQDYPDMNVGELPTIKKQSITGPSVFRISPDEKTLLQEPFDFIAETEVIVIAHPYCHFCQFLIKDIADDDELSKFFKLHSRWIADENYLDHIDAIVAWNKDYPMAHLDIAYLKQDFSQLDNWGTPAIYFVKDGKVLEALIGWPESGEKDKLMTHINNYFPDFE